MKNKVILTTIVIILILSTTIVSAYSINNTISSQNTSNENTINEVLLNLSQNYSKTNNSNMSLLSLRNNTKNITNTTNETNTAKLNKSRPIYFAMDHVNGHDEEIRDKIVEELEKEGFNVVSAEIGPNKMSRNTLYLYEHNVSDAIIFHLFNGVDPSTIRELAVNGNDNRGRIVRSRGNDVVLAWFYDSADCVNENGTGVTFIKGSETGPSLENPKQYMQDNDIIAICTSSDNGIDKINADYTGEKTAQEFIKLFE